MRDSWVLLPMFLSLVSPYPWKLGWNGTSAKPDSEIFKVSSSLVLVPVSVTGAEGLPVQDLNLDAFQVLEDGRKQEVAWAAPAGESPLELALVFDTSGSVSTRFDFEKKTGLRFLEEMLEENTSASIFTIGSTTALIQQRTADAGEAKRSLENTQGTGSPTAFYDAIAEASSYLASTAGPGARKALLALSDGEDNFSDRLRLDDLGRQLQRADTVFYSINPSGSSLELNAMSRRGQAVLEQLAGQTGGAAFAPARLEQLPGIFDRIAAELKNQYLLGYYSSQSEREPGFRRIEVRIPARPELRVRARQGYYAPGR